jgi:hypothetical protein
MLANQTRIITIAFAIAAVLSAPAVGNAGLCDWLFGSRCMTAQTTYTPAYYATGYAPACAAPSCAPPVVGCSSCAAPVAGCSSCAPQVAQYTPYVSYRPIYAARQVTTFYYPQAAYYPAAGCSTCATPVAAYYPATVWRQQVSLIPYTTRYMAYMPITSIGYAPAPACASCALPCGPSCAPSCGPCASTGCQAAIPATYDSPAVSYPTAVNGSATAPSIQAAPSMETPSSSAPTTTSPSPTESAQPPKTFQEQKPAIENVNPSNINSDPSKVYNPSADQELKPIPQSATPQSLPEPQLINPDNRTTSLPLRQPMRMVARVALSPEPVAQPKTAEWRESKD